MGGWGRGPFGSGYYGSDKAPLEKRILVLALLCTLAWLAVGVIYMLT